MQDIDDDTSAGAPPRIDAGFPARANPMDDERRHFHEVIASFREYALHMAPELGRRARHAARLPERYRRLMPAGALERKIAAQARAVRENQDFLSLVAAEQFESGLGTQFGEEGGAGAVGLYTGGGDRDEDEGGNDEAMVAAGGGAGSGAVVPASSAVVPRRGSGPSSRRSSALALTDGAGTSQALVPEGSAAGETALSAGTLPLEDIDGAAEGTLARGGGGRSGAPRHRGAAPRLLTGEADALAPSAGAAHAHAHSHGGRICDGHGADSSSSPPSGTNPHPRSSHANFAKVKSTLHQIVRDWSAEGAPEREASYGPILAALGRLLPVTADNWNKQRIAVPGCGLGRLVFELACRGWAAQGNEFAYHMLFTSHLILNCTDASEAYTVHPWVHDASNHVRADDAVRPVRFPDVNPTVLADLNPTADFSMAAGEFITIYGAAGQAGTWDGVATCFFIDTAPVVMEYLDVIWHMLRPGGVWVNLGPLLYHWQGLEDGESDDRFHRSLELSYEEVRAVILARGFQLVEESAAKPSTYAGNPRALMATQYRPVFFAVRKPGGAVVPPPVAAGAATTSSTTPAFSPSLVPTPASIVTGGALSDFSLGAPARGSGGH